jgi:hypothetical protein
MFLKPTRPKNLWFKPAEKISFDLTEQNKQDVVLERKDSSPTGHYLPDNKVRSWPPQNDNL